MSSVAAFKRDLTQEWGRFQDAPPQLKSEFERKELIGRGAFAEVWRVQDRESGCWYALKELRADCPNPVVGKQLLLNEAEIATRVDSPHLARLHGTQASSLGPRLIFEWLSGDTLESRLARVGRLGTRESLWIARQCVQALADLLTAGFTHGDIKPSNLFLCRSGLVKLIDLGFARPDHRVVDDLSTSLMGTPEYLAPDALVPSEQSGAARDLYALGVTLYRTLTGVTPFQGASVGEVMRQQQTHTPAKLRTHLPYVSAELEGLVERLLSKQPLRRPTGLRSLLHELVGMELQSIRGQAS